MNKRKILIVDDGHKIVNLLKLYLEKDSYRVFAAYDGMQALDYARQKQPDLIMLDLILPQIDGLDVCRKLSSDFKHLKRYNGLH